MTTDNQNYRGYSLKLTDDQIRELFHRRHGIYPEKIWRDETIAHAGPEPLEAWQSEVWPKAEEVRNG
jgi:hypothetical protein